VTDAERPTDSGAPALPLPIDATYGPLFSASCARGTADELAEWLAFAHAMCDAADAIALRHFRREVEVRTKPDRTFVTEADQAIERLIRERIAARFPDHGLVGEEYGEEHAAARARWHIDPIDGTHNFIRGVPLFGTLLALEVDGELQVGVMSAPALRERWYAARGAGSWAIGAAGIEGPRSIRVSGVGAVADSQILYGSANELRESGRMPGFAGLLGEAWRERGFGDFWGYALVAEGAAEAMIEVGVSTWDLAAPFVVIEEAGGRLTDLDGERRIDRREVLATNGLLHEPVRERLLRV
jgi:histidinol-phosphatase